MKKDNVIDLANYLKKSAENLDQNKPMSKELESAIEELIKQLREVGPLNS